MRDRTILFLLLGLGGVLILSGGAVAVYTMTRNMRNNNPGSIRLVSGVTWAGQVPPDKQTDREFVQFSTMAYGVRALAKLLLNYGSKSGTPGEGGPNIDTISEIINRWAPPSENDTQAYVRNVARYVFKVSDPATIDFASRTTLDIRANLVALTEAIIRQEQGLPALLALQSSGDIGKGIAMVA